MAFKFQIAAMIVCTGAVIESARAGTIYSPAAITQNTMGEFSAVFQAGFTINRSGLTSSFTSGVTSFSSYINATPQHTSNMTNVGWGSLTGVTTGTIDYDLGQSLLIQQLAMWPDDSHAPSSLTVFTADNPSFINQIDVGTFTPPNPPNVNFLPAFVFDLTDSTNRYVRLQINSSHTPTQIVAWGEIAFDASIVPEPSSMLVAAIGALSTFRRRSNRNDVTRAPRRTCPRSTPTPPR